MFVVKIYYLILLEVVMIAKLGHSFVMPSAGFSAAAKDRASPRLNDSETPGPESVPEANAGDDECSFMGFDEDYLQFPCGDCSGPDVVQICMDALMKNDKPYADAGLEVCFNFSSDRCRAAQGGNLEQFIQFARNPVFSSMVNAKEWTVKSTGPIIAGTMTRGAMQTVLVDVQSQNGKERRFLWTLQQERRPPRQGCWLVHECISTEDAFSHTL